MKFTLKSSLKSLAKIPLLLVVFVTVSYSASAQQDDFYKFFAEFQKDIKDTDWQTNKEFFDLAGFMRRIDFPYMVNTVNRKYQELVSKDGLIYSCYANNFEDNFARFIKVIQKDYKTVCNLSAKNKYNIEKKLKTYTETCGIYKDDDICVFATYKVRSVYRLYFGSSSNDGDGEGAIWCVFAKINGEWKIIDFSAAG